MGTSQITARYHDKKVLKTNVSISENKTLMSLGKLQILSNKGAFNYTSKNHGGFYFFTESERSLCPSVRISGLLPLDLTPYVFGHNYLNPKTKFA
jgi:hypothetical protein